MKTQKGVKGIALYFRQPRREVGCEWPPSRPGRFSLSKELWCPLYRKVGKIRVRFGRVRKISPLPGLCPPNRPARS